MSRRTVVRTGLSCLASALLALSLGGCGKPRAAGPPASLVANLEQTARQVTEGVAEVRQTEPGAQGSAIFVIEENHASRAGQIEAAVVLIRLYEQHGLRDVALEGFVMGGAGDLDSTWFSGAAGSLDQASREEVAVRLLREGEISGTEFLKLIRPDVIVHPIERGEEYRVELDDQAAIAPITYLLQIAGCSLPEDEVTAAERLGQQFNAAVEAGDLKTAGLKQKEFIDLVLAADPWAEEQARLWLDMQTAMSVSEEQQLAATDAVVARAEEIGIQVPQDVHDAIGRYREFIRERISATRTMVMQTGKIADRRREGVLALNIGAAHTQQVCALLSDSGRPFVVIRPASSTLPDSIPWQAWRRKYDRISLYTEGLAGTLTEVFFGQSQKKFEPVLTQPWLQAKAEIYLFTERIATSVLEEPPSGGGKPPYGLTLDDLRGRWISVDPGAIRVGTDTKDASLRVAIFPVDLNPADPARRRRIWVKAALGTSHVPTAERQAVEAMLLRVLEDVKTEKGPADRAEDAAGRVQVTIRTIAAFGRTQQEVERVVLSAI